MHGYDTIARFLECISLLPKLLQFFTVKNQKNMKTKFMTLLVSSMFLSLSLFSQGNESDKILKISVYQTKKIMKFIEVKEDKVECYYLTVKNSKRKPRKNGDEIDIAFIKELYQKTAKEWKTMEETMNERGLVCDFSYRFFVEVTGNGESESVELKNFNNCLPEAYQSRMKGMLKLFYWK